MAAGHQSREKVIELRGEKDLLLELAKKEPTFREVNRFLALFQGSCPYVTYKNLEKGAGITSPDIENQIWDSHMRINSRFRKLLFQFRDEHARRKRPVEERKLKHQYQKFISGAQQFYDAYLKSSLSNSCWIPELAHIAAELEIQHKEPRLLLKRTEELKDVIIQSCYSTSIRLGDLSRYYQMELVSDPKKREWDHVVYHYKLAGSIKPTSGIFHNQLAIISLAEANHLQATYYLYRALCATEPHPTADGNLEIEFKKILNLWSSGKVAKPNDEKEELVASFTYLHAMCYKGVDFAERDEIENSVLDQISLLLKEDSLDTLLLQQFCLVNIAAEAHAWTKEDTNGDAAAFFIQLNVKTFFALMQVLLAEKEKDSKIIRQVLPALRHYSSWLVMHSSILAAAIQDTPLEVQIKEFWKIYATTLTLLTSTFNIQEIESLDYLLQEDRDTLGFFPLTQGLKSRRYFDDEGNVKRVSPEETDPEKEMLFRVRELVIDGLDLISRDKIPIELSNNQSGNIFLYRDDEPLQVPELINYPASAVHDESTSQTQENVENAGSAVEAVPALDMDKMVDALVNSEADPCEDFTSPPAAQPWPLSVETNRRPTDFHLSAEKSVLHHPQSPAMVTDHIISYSPGPPLPSILNTPFAPQPGEVSPRSRPSTATHNGLFQVVNNPLSPLSYLALQPSLLNHPYSPSTPIMSHSSKGFTPTQSPRVYGNNAFHQLYTERVAWESVV